MPAYIEPRKQGRQLRAKATESAIIEATARLLEQGRLEALTTNKIAEYAGVSIGSLYQYFPNKEAILVALIRQERSLLFADVAVIAQSTEDPDQKIKALLDAGLKHQFSRPQLALQLEYVEQTLDIGQEAQDLSMQLASTISDIVKMRSPHADDHTARDVVAICQALINAAGLAGERDLPTLRQRLLKAVNGYLS